MKLTQTTPEEDDRGAIMLAIVLLTFPAFVMGLIVGLLF